MRSPCSAASISRSPIYKWEGQDKYENGAKKTTLLPHSFHWVICVPFPGCSSCNKSASTHQTSRVKSRDRPPDQPRTHVSKRFIHPHSPPPLPSNGLVPITTYLWRMTTASPPCPLPQRHRTRTSLHGSVLDLRQQRMLTRLLLTSAIQPSRLVVQGYRCPLLIPRLVYSPV